MDRAKRISDDVDRCCFCETSVRHCLSEKNICETVLVSETWEDLCEMQMLSETGIACCMSEESLAQETIIKEGSTVS